ncbi:CoA-transferase [Paenibacillus roseipurpureus]|uniref:CoA-transferase n=1 Tax=Paenibacillus roseopurpureus TaxID=2918901 RepID=A0AA96LM26_9BACL|nr:CoA-transferase [Paenibacillus sp. MBLB1832]WNR43091.1 CoA-transferase [Paenibacillus sp. MBLB1832]
MSEIGVLSYTSEEAMICYLARELHNHEVIGVGNNSPIPAAAALLAKSLHARDASIYILGQCDWPFQGTKEFFDLMQRGGMDVFFLSGAQIDSYGRINLHVIGDYTKPKVRLPGGAGSGVVYYTCKRIFLFKTDHGIKGFPENLDFVSSTPRSEQGVYHRSQLAGVYTPLGVMKPSGRQGRLQLAATVHGVQPFEVQERTGFDLGLGGYSAPIPTLEPPTYQELTTLRYGVSQELRRIYPLFAKQHFGTYMSQALVKT